MAAVGVEFGRVSDSSGYNRMAQSSFVGGTAGLFLSGSSASLSPYHHASGISSSGRSLTSNFASNKTKSLSLLTMERGSVEYGSSRRRMPTVSSSVVQPSRDRTAIGSAATVGLSYDRDQSLDRHVDRRRHRNRDSLSVDATGRYHTIGGYTRDNRGSSVEREYPHMGARMLEHSMIRSRSIDPEFTSAEDQPVLFMSDDNGLRTGADPNIVLELQSHVAELNRECALLQRDLEISRDKLSSSMNSVRTFWSPELKRERAQRKDDSVRVGLLVEQLRMAEVENKQHLDTVVHLEQENRQLRDLSLLSSGGNKGSVSTQLSTDTETDSTRRDRDRHNKELKLLKRTIQEMELRIETQKQTLATRD